MFETLLRWPSKLGRRTGTIPRLLSILNTDMRSGEPFNWTGAFKKINYLVSNTNLHFKKSITAYSVQLASLLLKFIRAQGWDCASKQCFWDFLLLSAAVLATVENTTLPLLIPPWELCHDTYIRKGKATTADRTLLLWQAEWLMELNFWQLTFSRHTSTPFVAQHLEITALDTDTSYNTGRGEISDNNSENILPIHYIVFAE